MIALHLNFLLSLLAAGPAILRHVAAQQNASTFIFSESVANITISLTAVSSTGDLWFRLSAPAEYDWVGIGIGPQMRGALAFVLYPTKNGTAVTLSPRLSSGHTEPEYNAKIEASKVDTGNATENSINAFNGGVMELAFVCKNCTNWSTPPLDLSSTAAPFMFAVGPISARNSVRWSNSPSAPLRSHSLWGKFTMDMTVATVQFPDGVTVPQLGNKTVAASQTTTKLGNDPHDYDSAFHAVTMCLAIGLFLPLDAVLYKLFRRTRVHFTLQGIALALFVVGLGLGIWVATWFVRSKKYNSAHQVLGLILTLLIIIELGLGAGHHIRRERARQARTSLPPPIGKARFTSPDFIHSVLGLVIFVLGMVEAAIGFNFALAPGYNKLWVPLVLAVTIVLLFAAGIRYCFDTQRKDRQEFAELDRRNAAAWSEYQKAQQPQQQARYGSQYARPNVYGGFGAFKEPHVELRPV